MDTIVHRSTSDPAGSDTVVDGPVQLAISGAKLLKLFLDGSSERFVGHQGGRMANDFLLQAPGGVECTVSLGTGIPARSKLE